MRMKRTLTIVLLLVLVLFGCSTNETHIEGLTMEERLEDFEYLYDLIVTNYPLLNVNERQNGINWVEEKDQFKERIKKTTTNQQFQREISNIVSRLNNNHTHVVDKNFILMLYGFYTDPEYADLFTPWIDVLADERVNRWYGIEDHELTPGSSSKTNNRIRPSNNFTCRTSIIVPEEVAYLKIEDMMIGLEEIEIVAEDIRKFLREVSDYDKLIIDIRGNPGGNDLYWRYGVVPPLIEDTISVDNYFFVRGALSKKFYESNGVELSPISQLDSSVMGIMPQEVKTEFEYYGIREVIINPIEPVGFTGEVFLLVDNKVFSSAEGFAAFAKDSGFATLVGVSTMGDGLSGNPLLASLPNSGIVIRFRGALPVNGDGTINAEVGTTPHVEMPNHSWRVGSWDEAIEYIIDLND